MQTTIRNAVTDGVMIQNLVVKSWGMENIA